MEQKRCPRCGDEKELGAFHNNRSRKDGKQSYCRECQTKASREWERKNKTHHRLLSSIRDQRRRARIENADGDFDFREWVELCQRYEFRCLCCGRQTKLEIDHIVPVVKGGRNDITNLQPLCRRCNTRKGTKTVDYRPSFVPTPSSALRVWGVQ